MSLNLEHLCRIVRENRFRLRSVRKALFFLRYQFELLAWKRNKLKLGAIVFEIKEINYTNIFLVEEINIRYIRQDTSREDSLTLEAQLKATGWHWNFRSVCAMFVTILLLLFHVYALARTWFYEKVWTTRAANLDYHLILPSALSSTNLFSPAWLPVFFYNIDIVFTKCLLSLVRTL